MARKRQKQKYPGSVIFKQERLDAKPKLPRNSCMRGVHRTEMNVDYRMSEEAS